MNSFKRATFQIACALVFAGLLTLESRPGLAVASGDKSERAESGDKDYAAGIRAFDAKDWQGVIDNMAKVVERRPWHDNALSRMGYAYRQLGDYEKSLVHYDRALTINPRNRGALEYLGEAYLDLNQPDKAQVMLDRLAAECKKIAVGFTNGGWKNGCEEWQDLNEAFKAYKANRRKARTY